MIYVVESARGYWTGLSVGGTWSIDLERAAITDDKEMAELDAQAWTDYWASKGYGGRAWVATFTEGEWEANVGRLD